MSYRSRSFAGFALVTAVGVAVAAFSYDGDQDDVAVGSASAGSGQSAGAGAGLGLVQAALELITGNANNAPQLSADHQAQVAAIFQQLFADLQGLRAAAQTQIQDLLGAGTQASGSVPVGAAPQVTVGAQTSAGQKAAGNAQARAGRRSGSGRVGRLKNAVGAAGAGAGTTATATPTAGGSTGGPATGARPQLASPFEQLNLTADQQTSVHDILDSMHMATHALRDQTRADLEALLTADQIAALEQVGATSGPNAPATGEQSGVLAEALQLSAEQQAQAEAIVTQFQADTQQLYAAAHEQILGVMSDPQLAQLEALTSSGESPVVAAAATTVQSSGGSASPNAAPALCGCGMHGGAHAGMPGGGLMAAAAQNLTDAQRAELQTVVDNLRTAVAARVQEAFAQYHAIVPVMSATGSNAAQ